MAGLFKRRKLSEPEQRALTKAFIEEQQKVNLELKQRRLREARERGRMLARGTAKPQSLKRVLAEKAAKKVSKFLAGEPGPLKKRKKIKQMRIRDPLEGVKV